MRIFLIAAFGMAGVLSRYYLSAWISRAFPLNFPLGTFLINVFGSLLIGVIATLALERPGLSGDLRIAIVVGLLGGFTTFSSFSMESLILVREGHWTLALFYLFGSPVAGLTAAGLGMYLVRK